MRADTPSPPAPLPRRGEGRTTKISRLNRAVTSLLLTFPNKTNSPLPYGGEGVGVRGSRLSACYSFASQFCVTGREFPFRGMQAARQALVELYSRYKLPALVCKVSGRAWSVFFTRSTTSCVTAAPLKRGL